MSNGIKIFIEFVFALLVGFSPVGDVPIKAAIKLGGVYFPDECLRSVTDSSYQPLLLAPCAPLDAGTANMVVFAAAFALLVFVIYINRDDIKELLGRG